MHWNLERVKNFDELWIDDSDETHRLGPETMTVILVTSLVGIPRITLKNAEAFFRRLRMIEIVGKPLLMDQNGAPLHVTLEMILRHVGLETSSEPLSSARFKASIQQRLSSRVEEELKAERSALASAGSRDQS